MDWTTLQLVDNPHLLLNHSHPPLQYVCMAALIKSDYYGKNVVKIRERLQLWLHLVGIW